MDAEELRASAAELAEAQRVAHIGNWTFDLQTQKVTWSDELYRIFEIDHRDFDGRYDAFLNRIHPDDQLHVLKTSARTRLEGASFDIEYRIITLAQQTKIIREVGYASRDRAGDVVRLFGTAQDITERKRAEERLKRSESHLAEAQSLAHVGSWEWDLRSGDVTWSDELYRIFGLQPGEIDVAHEAMSFIHTDDRDEILNTVRRSITTKEPYSFCYRVLRPDGDERVVHIGGTIHIAGVDGVGTAITIRVPIAGKS
ncbi:MAG: PAS domain S-box protein [Deltaproteobacteria bacterium]|nr:MAG: PAS domain S-box protein [Deltaproteobacteria bacterium]